MPPRGFPARVSLCLGGDIHVNGWEHEGGERDRGGQTDRQRQIQRGREKETDDRQTDRDRERGYLLLAMCSHTRVTHVWPYPLGSWPHTSQD